MDTARFEIYNFDNTTGDVSIRNSVEFSRADAPHNYIKHNVNGKFLNSPYKFASGDFIFDLTDNDNNRIEVNKLPLPNLIYDFETDPSGALIAYRLNNKQVIDKYTEIHYVDLVRIPNDEANPSAWSYQTLYS